jgi:hypothetical protein
VEASLTPSFSSVLTSTTVHGGGGGGGGWSCLLPLAKRIFITPQTLVPSLEDAPAEAAASPPEVRSECRPLRDSRAHCVGRAFMP